MIKEVLNQDKLNLTLVHGLLRHRDGLQRITTGDWDYIDQVSYMIFSYVDVLFKICCRLFSHLLNLLIFLCQLLLCQGTACRR